MAQSQPPPITNWVAQNRFIEAFAGQHQQDYSEADTQGLTTNGVLNTESGEQDSAGIALRWQGIDGWLVHFQAQRQVG